MTRPAREQAEDALEWLDTLDPLVKRRVIDDVTAALTAAVQACHQQWEDRLAAVGFHRGLTLEANLAEIQQAERRRIIALAREFGTDSTTALADQLAGED